MTTTKRSLSRDQIRRLIITGMLAAIVIIFVLTPLGMLQIGPVATTFAHIPVLIGLLAEGPGVGLVLALFFGGFSMFRAYQNPAGLAIFFQDPLVSILPRILIPLAAWGVYQLLKKWLPEGKSKLRFAWGAAGLAGSLTNTVFVLFSIYLLYGKKVEEIISSVPDLTQYASAGGKFLLFGIALPNGIPEAIVTLILVPAIMTAVTAVKKRR